MDAVTISEVEEPGASFPFAEAYSDGAHAVSKQLVTRRIEAFIARRWASRSVTYIAQGPGHWDARLYPFTLGSSEIWNGTTSVYEPVTISLSSLGGFLLDGKGPYKIVGTAGDNTTPPQDVREAFHRLREFFAATRENLSTSMAIEEEEGDYRIKRQANSAARAMQLSGAADLLRPYRNLGVA